MAGGTLFQPYAFAASIYIGLLIGALYTLSCGLHFLLGGGRFLRLILDIFYVLLSSAAAILCLYYVSALALRFYHFLGLFGGILLYIGLIHPLLCSLFTKKAHKRIDKK